MKHATLLLSLLFLLPTVAEAQTVNTEELRPGAERPGWSFTVRGSAAVRRGNVELLDLRGGGQVRWQSFRDAVGDAPPFLHHLTFVQASARFAEKSGEAYIHNRFGHGRWTAMWHPRVGSEVFAQAQTNRFFRLELRMLAGAGARFLLAHTDTVNIAMGVGGMAEQERIQVAEGANDEAETLSTRSTNYLTARIKLLEGELLGRNTVYAQPRFENPSDVRVLEVMELAAPIGEHAALSTSFTLQYDSAPPTDVERMDLSVVSSLSLTW